MNQKLYCKDKIFSQEQQFILHIRQLKLMIIPAYLHLHLLQSVTGTNHRNYGMYKRSLLRFYTMWEVNIRFQKY